MRVSAVLLLPLFLAASAAQSPPSTIEASGTFRADGAPERRTLSQVGDNCIVDLEMEYSLEGSLAGSMSVDYRIYVGGVCGKPPGTFDEQWIARGTYKANVDGAECEGPLVYIADVEAGGAVKGKITLAGDLEGTLEVAGRFQDGFLRYQGRLTRPPDR
jgi:hypothetical protein